jgi:hypothetical protein
MPVACGSGSSDAQLDDTNVLTSGGAGGNGGSAGAAGALSAGERFLNEYASAVCAMYEPCCNGAGLGFDAGGCTDWFAKVTAAYLPDEFRPELGAECLLAIAQARAEDADRCNQVALFDEATLRSQCERAFVAPARDGAPLLGACTLAGDCAAGGDDQVICYGGACVLQRSGASGDGPCYAGGNVGLAAEMFTCDAAAGLYCHRGDNQCTARVGDGERCPYTSACDDTAMCVGGTCKAFPDSGEPCLNAVPGAGGYCAADSACDVTTLTCGPGPAIGGDCSEIRKCSSGVCVDNVCASSDWQRNLNCVGRAAR